MNNHRHGLKYRILVLMMINALLIKTVTVAMASQVLEEKDSALVEHININIDDGRDIYGFILELPGPSVKTTYSIAYDDGENKFKHPKYKSFMHEHNEKRGEKFRENMWNRLDEILKDYDLSRLQELYFKKCNSRLNEKLEKVHDNENIHKKIEAKNEIKKFLANNKFTHAIYCEWYKSNFVIYFEGLMVDLQKMQITNPFCGDILFDLEWSPDSNYLVYAAAKDGGSLADIMVVRDVINNTIIFRKKLDKDIVDMVWDPKSEKIAVLCVDSRLILDPLNLLFFLVGHAGKKHDFYIQIYNMSGEKILEKELIKDTYRSSGRMLWTK